VGSSPLAILSAWRRLRLALCSISARVIHAPPPLFRFGVLGLDALATHSFTILVVCEIGAKKT
jgi:hypothetical protein